MPKIEKKLGPDNDLKELLATAIKQCRKSREVIAEEMSVLAGRPITKFMLDGWTSSKAGVLMPASLIQSFCEVTGSDRLQRWVIGEPLRKLLEFGELQLKIRDLRSELKAKGPRENATR